MTREEARARQERTMALMAMSSDQLIEEYRKVVEQSLVMGALQTNLARANLEAFERMARNPRPPRQQLVYYITMREMINASKVKRTWHASDKFPETFERQDYPYTLTVSGRSGSVWTWKVHQITRGGKLVARGSEETQDAAQKAAEEAVKREHARYVKEVLAKP